MEVGGYSYAFKTPVEVMDAQWNIDSVVMAVPKQLCSQRGDCNESRLEKVAKQL